MDTVLAHEAAALNSAGRFDEAEAVARQAIERQPDDSQAHAALASSLVGLNEHAEALLVAQRALKSTVLSSVSRHSLLRELVISCAQLGQTELGKEMAEAHRSNYETHFAADWAWPGIYLWILGLTREAIASHEAGLALFPGDCYLEHQLGTAQLSLGDRRGMARYKRYTDRDFWSRFYPEPDLDVSRMWQGEPLHGKSILVRPHGGVGDYIQFIRYARILKQLGAREIVAVLPTERIRGFLGSCPDVRIGTFEEIHTTDYWVSIFGLCTNLFLEHGTLAAPKYLNAPSSKLADEQLALIRRRAAGRRCISIAWHSDMADGGMRSIPLGALLPLFGLPNVHWVITQRGVALKQFIRAGLHAQCSVISETSTFDDTSALMNGLDGVVTVESYSLHMAGALGVPTWFLASRALDWRHLNAETESVWYPSVHLVRQPALGAWRHVVAELRNQLLKL